MGYYILEINNPLLSEASVGRVVFDVEDDIDPVDLWPWLDPIWGFVEKVWEGIDTKDHMEKKAELLIFGENDIGKLIASDLISLEDSRGRIFIDRDGRMIHVTLRARTPLVGIFAHDAFAYGLPRAEDLSEFLRDAAIHYIEGRVKPIRVYMKLDPEPPRFLEAMMESLSSLDLTKAEYSDLERAVELTLKLLADWD